jgi:hypothetical protein
LRAVIFHLLLGLHRSARDKAFGETELFRSVQAASAEAWFAANARNASAKPRGFTVATLTKPGGFAAVWDLLVLCRTTAKLPSSIVSKRSRKATEAQYAFREKIV